MDRRLWKEDEVVLGGELEAQELPRVTGGEQLKELQVENERLRNRVAPVNNNTITNNNIVIVNLPAVTHRVNGCAADARTFRIRTPRRCCSTFRRRRSPAL